MADVDKKDRLKAEAKAVEAQSKLRRNAVKDESKKARVKAGETFE